MGAQPPSRRADPAIGAPPHGDTTPGPGAWQYGRVPGDAPDGAPSPVARLVPIVAAGVLGVLGLVLWMQVPPRGTRPRDPPPAGGPVADGARAGGPDAALRDAVPVAAAGPSAEDPIGGTTGPVPRAVGLRVPPLGTPDDNAADFARLPVSPRDRAPVGAVGHGGIHVDRIALGTGHEGARCTGASDRFSIGHEGRVHACFRVVHARTPDEVTVLWQREGGTERRARLRIPAPVHGYRTRAALTLRRDYAGTWRVRVLSDGGAELAALTFTVVE